MGSSVRRLTCPYCSPAREAIDPALIYGTETWLEKIEATVQSAEVQMSANTTLPISAQTPEKESN